MKFDDINCFSEGVRSFLSAFFTCKNQRIIAYYTISIGEVVIDVEVIIGGVIWCFYERIGTKLSSVESYTFAYYSMIFILPSSSPSASSFPSPLYY
ncbi:1468_t:CDS:2 [Diversispora eburnea]|uniref:1468_t:CDS:1 n=1 Tax=Diversispora eburnea TaxID=1213867 RepID=A0A9N9B766_9GLOM|nr:1468_t:CDS:2 [Diversispora eburnea]